MKFNKPLLSALAVGTLLFAGNLMAQEAPPPPPPPPSAPMNPPPPPPPPATPMNHQSSMDNGGAMNNGATNNGMGNSAVYQTPQGEVTVSSKPAAAPEVGPAPSFSQLSGGGKSISEEQAASYPPLANDFLHADSNRNGSISKAEYARWTKQL